MECLKRKAKREMEGESSQERSETLQFFFSMFCVDAVAGLSATSSSHTFERILPTSLFLSTSCLSSYCGGFSLMSKLNLECVVGVY